MDLHNLGRLLLIVGGMLAFFGLLLLIIARTPLASWLSEFPGTIRIEGQGFSCIFPIALSLFLSVVLTILLNLIIRWINRP